MVERYVVDPQKGNDQTIIELAQKLNEVIGVVTLPERRQPRPRELRSADCVEYMEKMVQRVLTGPYEQLSKSDTSDELKAVGTVLVALQDAVKTYKESLPPDGG